MPAFPISGEFPPKKLRNQPGDTTTRASDEDVEPTQIFTIPKEPRIYDKTGKIVTELVSLTQAQAEVMGLNWDGGETERPSQE